MKIKMTNKRFPNGEANVNPRDVATWEAAGWVAAPKPKSTKQTTEKKDDDQ